MPISPHRKAATLNLANGFMPLIVLPQSLTLASACLARTPILEGTDADIPDTIEKRDQLAAVGKFGYLVILGMDEAIRKDHRNVIQILRPEEDGGYAKNSAVSWLKGDEDDGKEMDIEGITVDSDQVYIIGSHSAKQPRVKSDEK